MQQQQQHHPHQQQPQLSSPMFGAPQASLPSTNVTTEQIQKLLEENKWLILAILENQNQGKLAECAQYQSQLQKNLMYLAAIADAQSQTPGASATPTQMTPQPTISPQGHSMQQHPQSGISHSQPPQQAPPQSQSLQQSQPPQQSHPQQPQLQQQRQPQLQQQLQPLQPQQGAYPPQMLFQLGAFQPQDQQQISSYLQQQQAMMGSMGMRMGANNGIHPAMFSGLVGAATNQMDPRGRHDTGAGPSESRGMSSGQSSGGGGNRES